MTAPAPVLVGIPTTGWVHADHLNAMERLWMPDGSEVHYEHGQTTLVAKRLALAERVVGEDRFGALLFLDSDMVPEPLTLVRLLRHELPIVGALYFTRFPPYLPCAGYCGPDGSDPRRITAAGGPAPLERVDFTGTGCLLIQREALLRVPRPWFATPAWAKPGQGEDTHFCLQAAKGGLPVYVDTGCCVGHQAMITVDLAFVTAWHAAQGAEGEPT